MRKVVANARRGTRRKNKAAASSESNGDAGNNNNHSNGTVHSPGGDSIRNPSPKAGERRRPTENEAVLTAKNYRLAKELSELRVRHREENKNVTRLTMENMNLASRCREAISRVNELKKELAMHQRRTAQALASQRNHHRSASMGDAIIFGGSTADTPLSGSRADQVMMEMDRMDDLMAAQSSGSTASGSQLQSRQSPNMINGTKSNKLHPIRTDSPTEEDMFVDFDSPDNAAFVTATTTRLIDSPPTPATDGDEEIGSDYTPADIMATMDDFFPETASPKVDRKTGYDEGFPDDLISPAVSRPKLSSVFRSQSGKLLETTDEGSVGSSQSDSLSAKLSPVSKLRAKQQQQPQASQQQQQKEQQQKGLQHTSSIDMFEASFATTFPRSFSSSPETANASKIPELDESNSDRSPPEQSKKSTYDPFHMSPHISKKPSGDLSAGTSGSARSRDPPAAKSGGPRPARVSTLQSTDDEMLPPTPRRLAEENGIKPKLGRSSSAGQRNARSGSPGVNGDTELVSSVRSLRSRLERKSSSDSATSPDAPTGGPANQQRKSNDKLAPDTLNVENEKAASARARYEKALQASQPRSYAAAKSPRTVGRLNPNKFLEKQGSSEDLLAIAVSKSDDQDDADDDSKQERASINSSPSENKSATIAQEKSVRPSEIRAAADKERRTSPTATSLILKRLQQRRAKEQARNSSSDGVNLSTISGISRAESRRRLNARVAKHLASPEQQPRQLTPSPSDEQDLSPLGVTHKSASGNDTPMFRRSYSGGSRRHVSIEVDELMGKEESYTDSGDYQRKKSISPSGSSPEKTSRKRYGSDGSALDSPEAVARTARARERARRANGGVTSGGTDIVGSKRGDSYFPKTRPNKEPALVSPELGGSSSGENVRRDLAKTSSVI